MKRIVTCLAILLTALTVWAKPVEPATARRAAAAQLNALGIVNPVLTEKATEFSHLYIFDVEGGGFVVVAGDDCVTPILAYSTDNPWGEKEMPENVRDWMRGYDAETEYWSRQGGEPHEGWVSLASGVLPEEPLTTAVAPMMSTSWNQSPYYNTLCPYDEGSASRTVTGCVATATAQIMKYWEHPSTGYGSHSYTAENDHTSYGTLSANFGNTSYAWSTMPNALSGTSTTAQVNAVATLMYHIGIADEMEYDISANGGSGAFNYSYDGSDTLPSSQNSLINYFKYKPTMQAAKRGYYTYDEWCVMLRNELDEERPILYSGRDNTGGHSFVLDGYNASGQFHVNWGWGGSYDGYYTMGDLHPGSGGTGGNSTYTFNLDNVALIGIEPNTTFNTTTTITANTATGGTVSGAGSYSFGSTVNMTVTANEGYRYKRWSAGGTIMPWSFRATGGNYTIGAEFEALGGDTLSYCYDYHETSFGSSGTKYWGIRLPGSTLAAGNEALTAVQIYIPAAGTYIMTVYSGSSSPTTAEYTDTLVASSSDLGWNTLTLDVPMTLDATQALWITFSCSDTYYPAALSRGSGNADGMLWGSSFSSIYSQWPYTFMIKAITGTVPQVNEDCVIESFPYTMDFESGAPCWYLNDANNDDTTWFLLNNYGFDSSTCAAIHYAQTADDWLYSPKIINAGTYDVSWKARAYSSSYPETYQVWILSDSSTMIFNEVISATTWQDRTSRFTVAEGDTVSVLFRYLSEDKYYLFIDNIVIDTTPSYNLTVVAYNPATGTVGGSGRYTEGTTVSISATPASGYHFTHWNDGNTDNPRVVTVSSNITYTAYFEADAPVTYTVTATSANPEMGNVSGGGTYTAGSTATLTATPAEGYHFTHWNDGNGSNPRTITVNSNITYTAYFEANAPVTYTVTVTSANPAMGNVSGGGTYTAGSTATLTATPAEGCHFTHWNDGNNDNPRVVTVNSDITYTAYFEANAPNSFTVTVSAADPATGSVSGGGTYTAGSTATLTATPAEGYHFERWNDGNTDNPRTVTVNNNLAFIATFVADPQTTYTITVTSANPDLGSVSGGGTYTEGSTATLSATAFEGALFVMWNDANTDNPRTITVTSDAVFTAIFQAAAPIDTNTSGIGTVVSENAWQVYPNPATSQITISTSEEASSITIVDITGREVYEGVTGPGEVTTIDVSRLRTGTYFIRLTVNSITRVRKLIIE